MSPTISPPFPTVRFSLAKSKSTVTNTSRLVLLVFLILYTPLPTEAVSFGQCRILITLTRSLMNRVANIRAARGDLSGSARAKRIAEKLGGVVGLWGGMWSMEWDFLRNYAWRNLASFEMFGAVSDMNRLLRALNELTRMESEKKRATWVLNNYENVLEISKSLCRRLLQVFGRSGALRELVLTLQEEIEGGLVRDCVELGINDLKGLTQIVKDVASQYSTWAAEHPNKGEDL